MAKSYGFAVIEQMDRMAQKANRAATPPALRFQDIIRSFLDGAGSVLDVGGVSEPLQCADRFRRQQEARRAQALSQIIAMQRDLAALQGDYYKSLKEAADAASTDHQRWLLSAKAGLEHSTRQQRFGFCKEPE